jgi:hypothetical protein
MAESITPPSELLQLWFEQHYAYNKGLNELLIEVAQWGAEQELEACCEWLGKPCPSYARELRAARRPKPPSLKEQAIRELGGAYDRDKIDDTTYDTIRRALEALDD